MDLFLEKRERHPMALTDVKRIAGWLLAVPMALWATVGLAAPEQILVGKIYTMDTAAPVAEAVSMEDGRFTAVGNRRDVLAMAGPDTRVIELGANVAYPGFIDAHLHVASIGSALKSVDLTGATGFPDIVERVRARAAQTPTGELVVGRGWHQSKWAQQPEVTVAGFPDHAALSAAVPEHPVLLEHANGHSVMINATAMDMLGIDADTQSPDGGVIVKDAAGQPTGVLHETATGLVAPLARYDLNTAMGFLQIAQDHILSLGITSAHDAGVSQMDLQAQRLAAEQGDLKLRLYSMVDGTDTAALDEWLARGHLLATDDARLTVRSIKIVSDGALGSRTAWLHQPYSDAPDTRGVSTYTMADLTALIDRTRGDNWQVNVHAIGDRANSEVLQVFSETLENSPDHRFRIEHAQHLTATDPALFAELGVIASMQPIHLSSDRPWAIDRLGPARIEEGAYMWRKLLDLGVTVASGTDAPVEPVNPLANFYAAVTRKQLSGQPPEGYESGQKMARQEALYAMTMGGAIAGFEETHKGSVTVGKYADLTILSRDILTAPENTLLATEVRSVVVGGEVVFQQAAQNGQAEASGP